MTKTLRVKICRPVLSSSMSNIFLDVRRVYGCGDQVRATTSGVCISIDLHDLGDIAEKLEKILRGGFASASCAQVEFCRSRQILSMVKLRAAPNLRNDHVKMGSDDARFLLRTLQEFYSLLSNDSGALLNCADPEEDDDSSNEISWL